MEITARRRPPPPSPAGSRGGSSNRIRTPYGGIAGISCETCSIFALATTSTCASLRSQRQERRLHLASVLTIPRPHAQRHSRWKFRAEFVTQNDSTHRVKKRKKDGTACSATAATGCPACAVTERLRASLDPEYACRRTSIRWTTLGVNSDQGFCLHYGSFSFRFGSRKPFLWRRRGSDNRSIPSR